MKKILRFLRRNLQITVNEAKAAFLLAIIIIVSLLFTFLFSKYSGNKQSELIIEEYGDSIIVTKDEYEFKKDYKYKDSDNSYSSNNYERSNGNKVFLKFNFDPNLASDQELKSLGIPPYLCKIMLNYRSKGGKFKFKEDLLKIYGMKPELYESLSSYVMLPSKLQTSTLTKNNFEEENVIKDYTVTEKLPIPPPKKTNYVSKSIEKFDINTADTTQLIKLKGIGSVFALRIIKYRDMLGGFNSIDQVAETYGISAEVMEELKKTTYIKTGIKKIQINQVNTFRHPYIKYQNVKVLMSYRQQHGNFQSIEDLKKVKVLDDQTILRIQPYLDFN